MSRLRQLTKTSDLIREVRVSVRGEKGVAAVEFALILPMLLVMVFGIIDIGRLIQAKLIITSVSREGGSLASREDLGDASSRLNLLTMLQASGKPLNLNGSSGRIYISRIRAGVSVTSPPDVERLVDGGSLSVPSIIGNAILPYKGLSWDIYKHLVFLPAPQNTSDISAVTVVEVYYRYTPITPLPNFITGILSGNIGSKAVF
jgi:Flp pilus assembly pilin Flp